MKKYIATITNPIIGIVEQVEYVGTESATKALLSLGYIKEYDDVGPRPPKGIATYEPNKAYPLGWQVFKGGDVLESNTNTSSAFVQAEWTTILVGVK